MQKLTEAVRSTALDNGAALVGFAPISRFDSAPADLHPRSIFPDTKTAVVVGVLQARGTLKAVEEGTYWQAYNCDSYSFINEILATQLLRSIVMLLEDYGHTSVPVHNPFRPHAGRKTRAEHVRGPDGFVSLRMMGVAAGLGELGLSKVFLSPQFGPRQRLFAVLTEAELEPTPLFAGKVCDECLSCVKGCEAKAMGTKRTVTYTIEGRTFAHAPFDDQACAAVHRGDDPRFSPFWTGNEPQGETTSYQKFLWDRFNHCSICVGRGCVRSCLDHLEKTGKISKTFKTPLISRKRWKFNEGPHEQKEGIEE